MISVEVAIRERHSVRQYEDRPIPAEIIQRLKEEIDKVNVNAALLAPTAVNQQKFFFKLENDRVKTRAGAGFFSKVDLGIAEYHFEAASGKKITGYSLLEGFPPGGKLPFPVHHLPAPCQATRTETRNKCLSGNLQFSTGLRLC